MIKQARFILFLSFFFLLLLSFETKEKPTISQYLGKPFFDLNAYPTNEKAFELGRFLFYSPFLSKNDNTSCATCHLQTTGFAHVDHNRSHGTNGTFSDRNAPALVNLIWKKHFMWDGKEVDLFNFSRLPIQNPHEMDNNFETIISKLNFVYKAKDRFFDAFGDSIITEERILKALTYFMIELNSVNSKYDKVIRNVEGFSFSVDEKLGLKLFMEQCASCHKPPLFRIDSFESNGLKMDQDLADSGRILISGKKRDLLKFSVPSLRNIAESYPYMHDGRFQNLDEVLTHYQNIPKNKDKRLNRINFNDLQKKAIKSFLMTLTDTLFITNQRLGFPPND